MKYVSHKRTNITGFHLYEVPRVNKFIEQKAEKRSWLPGTGRKDNGGLLFNEHRDSLGDKKVLNLDGGIGAQ